jgi:N-acetylglucosaminyldiphosphoundecaprenol N-acetyl-beta-D-mannosaminyltransferase
VTGADLLPELMAAAAQARARVFLLGCRDGVAAAAARTLEARYPGLGICGVHEPPFTSIENMDNREILRQIAESRADILVVSLTHPKPEKWIDLHCAELSVSVAVNVGCALDLVTGRRCRAPLWMQRSGLEWLYRLLHEPTRLGSRYAVDAGWLVFVFLPRALSQRLRARVHAAPQPQRSLEELGDGGMAAVSTAGDEVEVHLEGRRVRDRAAANPEPGARR